MECRSHRRPAAILGEDEMRDEIIIIVAFLGVVTVGIVTIGAVLDSCYEAAKVNHSLQCSMGRVK